MHTHSKKGFTLIELLVVLVIMSLVTLAFLNNQSKFDSSTVMRSLAYSIALSVRQAQVYGISVHNSGGSFAASHGLYFSNANLQGYIEFGDQDNDHKYTPGIDLIDQAFKINNEYQITEACAVVSAASRVCTSGADNTPPGLNGANTVYVMFTRPSSDANIYAYDLNGNPVPGPYTSAYIKLTAVNTGDFRFISVSNTGQVSVCTPNMPITTAIASC